MKTYEFVEKNGSAVIVLSADDKDEAYKYLNAIAKFPDEFRLSDVMDEEE